jgi:hypothetical protein
MFQRLGVHLGHRKDCAAAYRCPSSVDGPQPSEVLDADRDLLEEHYRAIVRHEVFQDMADLYWNELFTETQMQKIRNAASRWIAVSLCELQDEIHHKYGAIGDEVLTMVQKRVKPFHGLASESQVETYAESVLPMPKVVENKYGEGNFSYNVMLVDWVVLMLRNDKKVRLEAVARSEQWKSGGCMQEPALIDHMDKGSTFRKSKFAQPDPDVPGRPRKLKIGLQMAYDDWLSTKNALSPHAPNQLMGGFYVAMINLDVPFRFEHENLCPVMQTHESVLKEFDMIRVLAGADPLTGEIIADDIASPGAQARCLAAGVTVRVSHAPSRSLPRPPAPCCAPCCAPCRVPCCVPCAFPASFPASFPATFLGTWLDWFHTFAHSYRWVRVMSRRKWCWRCFSSIAPPTQRPRPSWGQRRAARPQDFTAKGACMIGRVAMPRIAHQTPCRPPRIPLFSPFSFALFVLTEPAWPRARLHSVRKTRKRPFRSSRAVSLEELKKNAGG